MVDVYIYYTPLNKVQSHPIGCLVKILISNYNCSITYTLTMCVGAVVHLGGDAAL